jgi:hypothetical protein
MLSKLRAALGLLALLFSGLSLAHAGDLAGHWTADFDSQIGPQKYVYDFKVDGDKITGRAKYDHSMGKGENELTAIKCTGDDVSFTEPLKIEGNEITITYTGKISGDEMKLTRQVGDFGTEQIVAKRTSAEAKSPEAKSAETK